METEGQMAERIANYSDPPDDFFDIYPGWYCRFDLGRASSGWVERGLTCPNYGKPQAECTCGCYDDFGPYKTKAGLLSAYRALLRHAEKIGCPTDVENYIEPWFEPEYVENI